MCIRLVTPVKFISCSKEQNLLASISLILKESYLYLHRTWDKTKAPGGDNIEK
jgi:hypothetical protein